MKVNGKEYKTIWVKEGDSSTIQIINQIELPFKFSVMDLKTVDDFIVAIKDMYIRGAGLIGVTAGYGMYIAVLNAPKNNYNEYIQSSADRIIKTRPTAKNLEWAVQRQLTAISEKNTLEKKIKISFDTACSIAAEDEAACYKIGEFGSKIIEKISKKKNGDTVNILTHCNAGWLAFVNYGSALAPVYIANNKGIKVHVWVDETRPRNQGARLTAWELSEEGIDHHLIVDNAGGHLMQHGMVDLVFVGADRVTRTGDTANKIGTYLKALAANDNKIPFYVAFPSSTFDWSLTDGVNQIPIEERNENEVTYFSGELNGKETQVRTCSQKTHSMNFGFDVTPSRLITGLITEKGVCSPEEKDILDLYNNQRYAADE